MNKNVNCLMFLDFPEIYNGVNRYYEAILPHFKNMSFTIVGNFEERRNKGNYCDLNYHAENISVKPFFEYDVPFYPNYKTGPIEKKRYENDIRINNYDCIYIATPGWIGKFAFDMIDKKDIKIFGFHHTCIPEILMRYVGYGGRKIGEYWLEHFYKHYNTLFVHTYKDRILSLCKSKDIKYSCLIGREDVENVRKHLLHSQNGNIVKRTTNNIIYVGRLSKEKEPKILRKIISRIKDKNFIIVGDKPKEEISNVLFTGYIKKGELKEIYQNTDILILTSCEDTLGMVVLEAMTEGVTVLVPKTAPIASIVFHGKNGILYDGGRIRSLEREINAYYNGKYDASLIGNNARTTVEIISWEMMAMKMESAIRSTLNYEK